MTSLRLAKERLIPVLREYADDNGLILFRQFEAACYELEICGEKSTVRKWWIRFHNCRILRTKIEGQDAPANQNMAYLAPEYIDLEPVEAGTQEVHT